MSLDSTEEFNIFLAGVERRAFRMAHFATGDADEALDLVQDAMFAFVRQYAGKPEAEWGPLFQRTLQNRITDWYRRNAVRNRIFSWFRRDSVDEGDDDPIASFPDSSSPDPEKAVLLDEAAQAIERSINKLPFRQRQAFLLRVWEGLDVAGTARSMGCSEGSVKTHYSRAIHALRNMLGEYRL